MQSTRKTRRNHPNEYVCGILSKFEGHGEKAWRRIAWACVLGGRPHLPIFGAPDARAAQESLSRSCVNVFLLQLVQVQGSTVTKLVRNVEYRSN